VVSDDYLALSTDGKKGDLRESVATSPLRDVFKSMHVLYTVRIRPPLLARASASRNCNQFNALKCDLRACAPFCEYVPDF
jgi:hypothetical protein